MHNRISSWPAVGVMCNLLLITSDDVRSSFVDLSLQDMQIRYRNRNDTRLSQQLTLLKGVLGTIHAQHPRYGQRQITFENLVKAAESSGGSPLYNQSTCAEFHDLLISVLVGYAKALRELNSAGPNPTSLPALVQEAWFISRFLWEITESLAYRMHLDAIIDRVEPIIYSALRDYEAFSRGAGLDFRDATGMSREFLSSHRIPEPDVVNVSESVAIPTLTYKGIISRQVAYPAALTLLLKYCTTLNNGPGSEEMAFSAHLIMMKPSDESITWSGIKHALSQLPLEPNLPLEVESVITDVVTQESSAGPKVFRCHKSFQMFIELLTIKRENDGKRDIELWPGVKYPGIEHAEIGLVALLKFWQDIVNDLGGCDSSELLDVIKVSAHVSNDGLGLNSVQAKLEDIAISKSCCPVCWEFLITFGVNPESPPFKRGRHSTLYFSELPKWLPLDVLETFLKRMRELAASELRTMVWKYRQMPNTPLVRTPSQNVSIASNLADDFMLSPSDNPKHHLGPSAKAGIASLSFQYLDNLGLKFFKRKYTSKYV
jgi:hypothetical protein